MSQKILKLQSPDRQNLDGKTSKKKLLIRQAQNEDSYKDPLKLKLLKRHTHEMNRRSHDINS